jgi:hypothetical protein
MDGLKQVNDKEKVGKRFRADGVCDQEIEKVMGSMRHRSLCDSECSPRFGNERNAGKGSRHAYIQNSRDIRTLSVTRACFWPSSVLKSILGSSSSMSDWDLELFTGTERTAAEPSSPGRQFGGQYELAAFGTMAAPIRINEALDKKSLRRMLGISLIDSSLSERDVCLMARMGVRMFLDATAFKDG